MPSNNFVIDQETRPVTLFAIAVTGVLASAFLGGSTNAINGLVSPRYFVTVVGWDELPTCRERASPRECPKTSARPVLHAALPPAPAYIAGEHLAATVSP